MSQFHRLFALIMISAAFALAPSPSHAAAHHSEKGEKSVAENRDLQRRFLDALAAKNVDAIMSTYAPTPDLVSVGPGGIPLQGQDAIRKDFERYLAGVESVRIEMLEESYAVLGDAVMGRFKLRLIEKPKGGQERQAVANGVDLRRQFGGKWLVVFEQVTIEPPMTPPSANLYQRLGGYDAIAAVVDEFIKRMAGDPKMARFLDGMSVGSQARLRQLIVDQVCAAAGGPCVYTGRDMKASHKGLGISSADWDTAAGYLVGALDHFSVGAREKNDLLSIVGTLKADIVEK